MEAVFLTVLNMSLTASWLVLAVMLLRLVLKKAPKAMSVCLWALVAVRLLCPVSLESIFSLIPSAEPVPNTILYDRTPTVHSGVPLVNDTVNHILSENFTPQVGDSVNPLQIVAFVASIVWIVGMAAMLLYTVISYVRIRRDVREAVPHQDNVWLCDRIDTPFILGVVRPRIYLPSAISEADIPYVIAHENAHLQRRDHFWKPLGFLLLTVYWFNPLLWVAYVLLCKDIELACDEKVIKELGADGKKPYSEALLNCSLPRKRIAACPLAFGEVGIKGRIKSVLHYKKPAFWVIVAAVVLSVTVAVCFLTNPKSDAKFDIATQEETVIVQPVELVYYNGTYSYVQPAEDAPIYKMSPGMQFRGKRNGTLFLPIGTFEEIPLNKNHFDSRFLIKEGASWVTSDTLESLKHNNHRLWQVYDETSDALYLLLEQNDGTFYLGCGTYGYSYTFPTNPDESDIRWLYKVKIYEEDAPITTTTTTAPTAPTSDYTGVALKMPEYVSTTYESYDHTAFLKVMPYSANVVKMLSSDGSPTYVELSEERIKELNALYESITEFKDCTGEPDVEPLVEIKRDGETYRLGWGCATQRALNLYIDKILCCDVSDEDWREIDNMEYLSEIVNETTTTYSTTATTIPSPNYTGVALKMPDSISSSYSSYASEVVWTIRPYDSNTVECTSTDAFEETKRYVDLSEDYIIELNSLFESVTDFSGEYALKDATVTLCYQGKEYIFDRGYAHQRPLNLYIDKMFLCYLDIDDDAWWNDIDNMTYPIEEEDPLGPPPGLTGNYTGVPLNMPDSVSLFGGYENATTVVMPYNANTLKFITTERGQTSKLIELTQARVKELNALYEAVTDFSEIRVGVPAYEVQMFCDGELHTFGKDYAVQEALNQYIDLLFSLATPRSAWDLYDQQAADREIAAYWEAGGRYPTE